MTTEEAAAKTARDKLWTDIYNKWYEAFFNETVANRLVARWQSFNDPSKVIVAITASGSVIAGWTLWNRPEFKDVWLILAGTGALLSVVSTSLTVAERIKDWISTKKEFAGVRVQAEILLTRMRLNPSFDIPEMLKSLENILLRNQDAVDRMRNDFLHTKRLDLHCKAEIDQVISERKLWA